MFDLYLLPVYQKDNLEQAELPGLLVAKAPKRADRTKLEDIFIAYLAERKPGSVAAEDLKYLLEHMSQVYYSSPGTITAGMRKAADQLNAAFLKFNVKQKQPVLVVLNLAVLRRDSLYLVHVGETITGVLNKEQVNLYRESPASPSALGIVQGINLRFFQTVVTPGTLVVMSPVTMESWAAELQSTSPHLSLEYQRRRILQHASGADYQALIWQVKSGSGIIHLLKRRGIATTAEVSENPVVQETPPGTDHQPFVTVDEADRTEKVTEESDELVAPVQNERLDQGIYLTGDRFTGEEPDEVPIQADENKAVESDDVESAPKESVLDRVKMPSISLPKVDQAVLKSRLVSFIQMMQRVQKSVASALKASIASILPGTAERTFGVPSSVMLFIAIAVPLVVVAVSATVYLQRGLGVEQKQYLQEASEMATLALAEQDATLQRIYWDKVLQSLDEADVYGVTEESRTLRSDVLSAVDKLDGIERVEVVPISLGDAVDSKTDIVRIVASDTELFILDRSLGRIMRLFLSGDTFQLDTTFDCGTGTHQMLSCEEDGEKYSCEPDPIQEGLMGPPVDLLMLPLMNTLNTSIMAIDSEGTLMYCKPGQAPLLTVLSEPSVGWGQIAAFSLESDVLYIMDKGNNALYYSIGSDSYFPEGYLQNDGSMKTNLYTFFTGDYVPQFEHIRDMKVNSSEVFLLKDDGTMISCIENNGLRCEDPAPYGDIRKGNDTTPEPLVLAGENFTQMQITQPSMPAIFLLDLSRQAVYQFTWRLNLVRQLRARGQSGFTLPETSPTAFAVTPNHQMIVAYGSQLYFGPLP